MNEQLTPSEMAQRSVAKRLGGLTTEQRSKLMSRVSKGKKVKKMMRPGTYQQAHEQTLAGSENQE